MSLPNQQDQFREKLAAWLGITYDELEEYGEDVEALDNYSEVEDYDYFIQFSEVTPSEILTKMDRIGEDNIVYFNLEELE
ncbi:hypothetical protein [Dyadobacter psychrotolerans]|uniref:Uncharacterized protein n=1 Tax=Dyadobacter psychrotolerans TaxID=2541721 RepID=A0A4R5DIC7_9BACT|nr:hypothetical protein [Dyadobacter psychrotolerans]TDE10515.1 hypothetical protein E0F88_27930 [Dyadobacter psychrotolerans]